MAEEHNAIKYAAQISSGAALVAGGGYADVGISRLGETLTPVLDLWGRPEHSYPRGERRFSGNIVQGPVAAEFQHIGISNPTNSNLLVVVENFVVDQSVNSIVTLRIGANIAFGGTGIPQPRDTRIQFLSGTSGVRCQQFTHSAAALIGTMIGQYRFLANSTSPIITCNVVLTPGFWCAVANTAVNLVISGTFQGYERVAFPGETRA